MKIMKQWEIEGFSSEISKKIDSILMNDNNSYWYHFRTIPWFNIRRIAIENCSVLKKIVLTELNIQIEIVITKKTGDIFSKWIIKPMKSKSTY